MEPLVNESPLPAARDSRPSGVAHTEPAHMRAGAASSPGADPGHLHGGTFRAERRGGRAGVGGRERGGHKGTQRGHRAHPHVSRGGGRGQQRATDADSATRSSRRHGPWQTPLARAGGAGAGQSTGQADRAMRSGDGADALSQERGSVSNTHAKLRTKHTEEQTHTTMDPVGQTEKPGGRLGQRWLPACLQRTKSDTFERSRRGCEEGPVSRSRGESEGGEHPGRWAGSSARMLLPRSRGVSGTELVSFFLLRGDVRRHHSHSREGTWGAGSRQVEGSPGRQEQGRRSCVWEGISKGRRERGGEENYVRK